MRRCFWFLFVFALAFSLLCACEQNPIKNGPEVLHAPWRHEYFLKRIGQEKNDGVQEEQSGQSNQCVFCTKMQPDFQEEKFVLKRLKHCAIVTNTYPYSPGHLMVIPYEHARYLGDYSREVLAEIMEAIILAQDVLQEFLNCDSFNVGMNVGPNSGGSIEHLHIHILPRPPKNYGFVATLANTIVIPVDVKELFDLLREEFEKR